MARIKYDPAETPLVNKHLGYTFQPNHNGQSMFPGSRSARKRYPNQNQQQQNLMKAVTQWRNFSPTIQDNWNTFAATYPQASLRNPAIFLTGYQLFCKRNHYCFLNHGITADFLEEPILESLPVPAFTVTIENTTNVLDITANYLKYFGVLPAAGDFVLCKIYPMAVYSGQFFASIELTLEVLAVYLDGLFLSFAFTVPTPYISYSVYLSKPTSQGKLYSGTKTRYMGCFSSKTFLELTDTPDAYTGEAGKQIAVKGDESGLEFIAGGGGGISCADLPTCPTIISIQNQIVNIASTVVVTLNISVPPVNYGLLYNFYIVKYESIRPILKPGWHHMSVSDVALLVTAAGGAVIGGGVLKENGFDFWDIPNTAATNSLGFNARGSGSRGWGGAFTIINQEYRWWYNYEGATYGRSKYLKYNAATISQLNMNKGYGLSLRPVKDSTTLADGETGVYFGNNGKIYRTICISGLEILSDAFAETIFFNGDPIPEITNDADFFNDVNGALCAFNNDWANV